MSVVPTMHVGVGVILAGRLLSLQVCVVEYLGRVCSSLAFLQRGGHGSGCRSGVFRSIRVEFVGGNMMATGA